MFLNVIINTLNAYEANFSYGGVYLKLSEILGRLKKS